MITQQHRKLPQLTLDKEPRVALGQVKVWADSMLRALEAHSPFNIEAGTIVTDHIADEAVTTPKLADGAVTADKVGADWPKVLLTNSIAQSVADITETAVSFDTELVDVGGMHAGGAPTRITVTRAGLYAVTAFVDWGFNNLGGRRLRVKKNGTTDIIEDERAAVFTNQEGSMTLSGHTVLAAMDYLELYVFQNTGGALNVNANETGLKFAAVWCP